jgi:hypothetical protein
MSTIQRLASRRAPAAAALLFGLLLAGCASSHVAQSNGPTPEIQIAQAFTGVERLHFSGPVPLSYVLRVKNPLSVPVTLKRVELRTSGSGAYHLNAEALGLHRTIAPGGEETFELSTWGLTRGGFLRRGEPVTVIGTAFFDTPQGQVAKIFTEYLPQLT